MYNTMGPECLTDTEGQSLHGPLMPGVRRSQIHSSTAEWCVPGAGQLFDGTVSVSRDAEVVQVLTHRGCS